MASTNTWLHHCNNVNRKKFLKTKIIPGPRQLEIDADRKDAILQGFYVNWQVTKFPDFNELASSCNGTQEFREVSDL